MSSIYSPSARERFLALLDILGYLYLVNGKADRAREYFRLMVRLQPHDSRLLRALGTSELEAGDPGRARILLEESLQLAKDHRERGATHLILSRALLRLNLPEESARAAESFAAEYGPIS